MEGKSDVEDSAARVSQAVAGEYKARIEERKKQLTAEHGQEVCAPHVVPGAVWREEGSDCRGPGRRVEGELKGFAPPSYCRGLCIVAQVTVRDQDKATELQRESEEGRDRALRDAKLAGVLDDRADESATIVKRSEQEEKESVEQLKQLQREVSSPAPMCPGLLSEAGPSTL